MYIPRLLKRIIKDLLLKYNLRISRTTSYSDLLSFFSSLQPYSTNYNLIRIGSNNDGGYLIPDDLDGINACFSPGVSDCSDFEFDLATRGIKCFLADFSVNTPPISHKLFYFDKIFLGSIESQNHITLNNWIDNKTPNESEFILQMDIEGSEYAVILDTSRETLMKFRILVIEFHELDLLSDNTAFQLISLCFKKLLSDFEIIHIHPNNCAKPIVYNKYEIPPTIEFTFLRKDRILKKIATKSFPHPLDMKNIPHKDDFNLPKIWF